VSLVVCHTADWHLGKTLHGASLERAHAAFLDWLVELVVTRGVDVLVVAGDVFDRSVPPASAEQAFYGFLARLGARAPGVMVVVVAGNHDGPARIAAPAPLLDRLGVRVVGAVPVRAEGGRPAAELEALVVPLTSRRGAVAGQLVAMPFLRPADLSLSIGGEPVADPVAAARSLFDAATELARSREKERGGRGPLLACGHGQVRGARLSPESERPLLGGEDASLPLDVFPDELDYVALGHLHLAQGLGPRRRGRGPGSEGLERVRYAGAPLPLAFSERDYPHQVVVACFEGDALARVEAVRVPRFLELVRVAAPEGSPFDVDGALDALRGLGEARAGASPPVSGETWVQVRVRLDGPRPALKRELASALERGGASGLRLVHVDVERPRAAPGGGGERLAWPELSPRAVLERVWSAGSREPLPEVLTLALEEAWRDTQAAGEERSEP
jgi:exonuclease SbcD